jgi:hypothetical protein
MGEGPDRLIVEHLEGEVLVYDPATHEAHSLGGSAATEFAAAGSDVSRREVLRKLALAGAVAAGGTALFETVLAPTPAHAQSAVCQTTNGCSAANQCPSGCCCQVGASAACVDPAVANPTVCCGTFGGTCLAASDRNIKQALHPADPRRVLGLVAAAS